MKFLILTIFLTFSVSANTKIVCQEVRVTQDQELFYVDSWLVMEEVQSEEFPTAVRIQYYRPLTNGNYGLVEGHMAYSSYELAFGGILFDPLSTLEIYNEDGEVELRVVMASRIKGIDDHGNEYATMLVNIFTDKPILSFGCYQFL